MLITALVENSTVSSEYNAEHGLCLYVETSRHKLLFDLGGDELFLENAYKLHIDIAAVDTVILSHGHSDHGGGLKRFLGENSRAKVYAHARAFEPHYAKFLGFKLPIGLDESLLGHERIHLLSGDTVLDDELRVFTALPGECLLPAGNTALLRKENGGYVRDDFTHEQNLIITEGNTACLFAGCAHRGALNILDQAKSLLGRAPEYFIGGFHLRNPLFGKSDSRETIQALASELTQYPTDYYTCHCTGGKAYRLMSSILGDQLHSISTGASVMF